MNAIKGQGLRVFKEDADIENKIYFVVKANDRYKYPFFIESKKEFKGNEENVVFYGTEIDCGLFVQPINDRIDRLTDEIEKLKNK